MPKARRGELWMIDLGMVQKARPCLVLSIEYLDHERAVVSYVPRTTHLRETRLRCLTMRTVWNLARSMHRASAPFRWQSWRGDWAW